MRYAVFHGPRHVYDAHADRPLDVLATEIEAAGQAHCRRARVSAVQAQADVFDPERGEYVPVLVIANPEPGSVRAGAASRAA